MKQSMEERLDSLEQHARSERSLARRWRRAACGSWTLLAVIIAVGAAVPEDPGVGEFKLVQTQLLEVIDEHGALLARIGPDGGGFGEVSVVNEWGGVTTSMGTTLDGHGALVTRHTDGTPIGFLGGNPDGDGGLWVSWGDGKNLQYVGADVRGNGFVSADAKGGRRL